MWASVVAVIGTLAGSIVTGLLQRRAARADRQNAQADQRRTEQIQAVTALAKAVSDHRRAMWEVRDAQLTEAGEDRVRELRDESHRTRSEITEPAVRVRLLHGDAVRAAAHEAVQSTYRMRDASSLDVLETLRAAALLAHDDMVDAAGRALA